MRLCNLLCTDIPLSSHALNHLCINLTKSAVWQSPCFIMSNSTSSLKTCIAISIFCLSASSYTIALDSNALFLSHTSLNALLLTFWNPFLHKWTLKFVMICVGSNVLASIRFPFSDFSG